MPETPPQRDTAPSSSPLSTVEDWKWAQSVIEEFKQYVRFNHKANAWHNDSDAWETMKKVVEPSLKRVGAILATLSQPPATEQIKREALERAAKAIFDGRPHNHPDGKIPNWDHQPEHIKSGFRRDAAAALAATEKER